jgi:hypothetical protein
MRHISIAIAICTVVLVGCRPTRPDPGEVFISTVPPGASCIVARDGQPIGQVTPTPGIVLVGQAPSDLTIECRRGGFRDGAATTRPRLVDAGLFSAGRYEYDPVTLTLVPLR